MVSDLDLPAAISISSPAEKHDELGPMLEQIRAKHKLPGLAAVVLQGDKLVSEGVAGVRKAGATEPVGAADKFHLGSNTKAMTATLLAMLVEDVSAGLKM
jgi:CubicO group peptidase (beta-lactamase class C family)